MLWHWLGLQRKLDALFDDGWIRLGLEAVPADGWWNEAALASATNPPSI